MKLEVSLSALKKCKSEVGWFLGTPEISHCASNISLCVCARALI